MTGRGWKCKWHTEGVFTLSRTTAAAIEQGIGSAGCLQPDCQGILAWPRGVTSRRVESALAHDWRRSCLGNGEAQFAAARRAFARWAIFDLGWVRVANPDATICPGQIIAVEAHTLGLWTLNLSKIMTVVDNPTMFGFIYATTPLHVEQGEERFLLEFDRETGDVWYELEAVSRPTAALARLGFPITRAFQERFSRESHDRMRQETIAGTGSAGF